MAARAAVRGKRRVGGEARGGQTQKGGGGEVGGSDGGGSDEGSGSDGGGGEGGSDEGSCDEGGGESGGSGRVLAFWGDRAKERRAVYNTCARPRNASSSDLSRPKGV